ncbi:MAG: zinc ribbon-containing protein [Methylococcaceae bacterium]|nr:zinc ribbon-containing protein [Methylococcaceae bacterium]
MDKNKLTSAYTELMEHLYIAMDNTLHTMADALEIAKEKIGKAGDLTLEEIDIISDALKRDIESAAHGLPDQKDKNSLSEWFKFDIELIENFALDAFLSIADKTRIELAKLGEQAKHHVYQSGAVTLPGTFRCEKCGKEIAFKETSQIPQCPVCHGHLFQRI